MAQAHAAPSFDKQPTPPRAFDGIRAGMSVGDAKAALASFAPDDAYRDAVNRTRLVKDAGDGARYYVLVQDDVVSRIGVEAPRPGFEARLTRLWGAPRQAKTEASEAITSWLGDRWRVDLSCRAALCRLAFREPLTAEFFGAAVAPPGALAGLRPGMTRDEIAKLAPRYAGGAELPAGPDDVRVMVDLARTGHLRSVLVAGLPANARALLEHAWGAPSETGEHVVWLSDQGWRAEYDEALHNVQLAAYLPAAKLLGGGPAIAALPAPILGATADQILARYPSFERARDGGQLALPPIERATAPFTVVGVTIDPGSGRAKQLAIQLPFDATPRRDELVKLMEAKWGAAAVRKRGPSRIYTFSTGPLRIEALETGSALELQIQLQ